MPFGVQFEVANKARTKEANTANTEKAKTRIPTTSKEAKATTTTIQTKTKTKAKENDYTTTLGTINQEEQERPIKRHTWLKKT